MTVHDRTEARGLLDFLDSAPSPYHAVEALGAALEAAGFERRAEAEPWPSGPGRHFIVRAGALAAIAVEGDVPPERGALLFGAHTDSPNLRIKPHPDTGRAGWRQLGVEVYGGALLNSWLDRDLGLSGRAIVRTPAGPAARLFHVARPLLRVPQLAIHLDREIGSSGLLLDRQRHMAPVWGLGQTEEHGFREFLAGELDVASEDVLAWDAMCHDLTAAAFLGRDQEFIVSARLDNLASCYFALRALVRRLERGAALRRVPILCFFDHEEVGSGSASGAQGTLLPDLVERSVLARGGGREAFLRARADSICVSSDMAHATHPNYAERHEPDHTIAVNGGPVVKINTNQRYATDAWTQAWFQEACRAAEVPCQRFVTRSDLACGSTIGPLTAANQGVRTVDVGAPQLSMHSARELSGARDVEWTIQAFEAALDA